MSVFLSILSNTVVSRPRVLSGEKIALCYLGCAPTRCSWLATSMFGSLAEQGIVHVVSWQYGRAHCKLVRWSRIQYKKEIILFGLL